MGISIGGIVSGLDTESLIEGLVEAYSVPKLLMEEDLAELEEEQEAVAGLETRLEDLQTALEALSSEDELLAWSAVSDDTSVVSVSAEGDAVAGSWSVEVLSLASAETEVSQGYADQTEAGVWGSGTLSITVAGVATEIVLDGTETLEDIADRINEQVDGVTAYVMDTGDATAPYRLVIAGEDTGAAATLEIDTSGLTGGTAPTFTETSTAADASLTIDGVTVTSDSNTVEVVPGVTLTLEGLSTEPVEVTVGLDVDAIAERVQAFVDAYNEVMAYVREQSVYDAEEEIKGPFVADSTVSSITRSLSEAIVAAYSASDVTGLAQIGITTEQDGDLAFDPEVFAEAFDEDADAVIALFTDTSDGFAVAFDAVLDGILADDGPLDAREESLAEEVETLEERISDFDEQMDAYEERLRAQFTAMELALAELEAAQASLTALFSDTSTES